MLHSEHQGNALCTGVRRPCGNLESDHLALQECSNSKEQLLFLATWPWRQRHYNPLKSRELLAHQQSITILQTGIYSIRDSCWLRILSSHVWDVTVCSLTDTAVWREGIASTCMASCHYTPSYPTDCNPCYSNHTTSIV